MTIRPKYETASRHNRTTRPTKAERVAAYEAVTERSGGLCEGCGRNRAEAIHHRLYRSRGGEDTIPNLMALCGRSNVDGCHGVAHTLIGEHLGWSVRSGNDPAVVPVFAKATQSWSLDGVPVLAVLAVELMVACGQIREGLEL